MHRFKFILPLFLCCITGIPAAAEISVTASFNPPRVALGDSSQYVVEIKESDSSKRPDPERVNSLPIPENEQLSFSNGRTSTGQQTHIINGVAEYSVTQQLIIDAKASQTGSFTIPSYEFEYKGQSFRVPDRTLEVVERPPDAAPPANELIFLKTDVPDQLYVGQGTSIELKLYISDNIRLSRLNSFDSSANSFTVSDLSDSENQESVERIQDRRYRVLTWPLTITPIQAGTQDLNFQFGVTASLPSQNRRRDPFGGRGFGSIFDDFFGQAERFTVYTEPSQIEVLPLPTEDQPDSFTGAIGDFSMQVYTDRKRTRADEPIMLSVEISGKGNFDRINSPNLDTTDAWRSYPPEIKFQAHGENNSLRGNKRFDYVLLPNKDGDLEIPKINFAYFDPDSKQYTELSSPPIPIEVSPSNKTAPPAPSTSAAPDAKTKAPNLQKELSAEDALLTLDYRPRGKQTLGRGILTRPRFWITNLIITLALLVIAIWLRHRRRLTDDQSYAQQQAAKHELRTARKAALASNDPDRFYAQAQAALRLALTCRTRKNLRTADSNELTVAMQTTNIAAERSAEIRRFFTDADTRRFGGMATQSDLSSAKAELERLLKTL